MANFRYVKPKKLCTSAVPVSPTVTIGYTVPQKTVAILKDIDVANTSAAFVNLTIYLVPSGGSPSADNTLIPACEIPPNSVFQWSGTQNLEEGDSIQYMASASGCAIHCSGAEAV